MPSLASFYLWRDRFDRTARVVGAVDAVVTVGSVVTEVATFPDECRAMVEDGRDLWHAFLEDDAGRPSEGLDEGMNFDDFWPDS